MPIETIEFKNQIYPKGQAEGFAAQWSFPLAKRYCIGIGYDVGCNRPEWAFDGAIPVDPAIVGCEFDAYSLPYIKVDYIFSSHCLEHLPDYVKALNYWHTKLHYGGVLFLYLPNCDYQKYWAPTSNRKHIHHMTPHLMKMYFEGTANMWANVFVGEGFDLNGSFYVMAEKK